MAEELNNTSPRWWSLAQTLVWIIQRIEMLPRAAEQIANSPEMDPKIDWALNELKKEFYKAVLGVTKGMPIDKFRILLGGRYVDLLTLIPPLPSAESGALSAAMNELKTTIRWQDVEYNSDWLKRAFPAPAPAAEALAAATPAAAADRQLRAANGSEPSPSSPPSPAAQEPPPSTLVTSTPVTEEPEEKRPETVVETPPAAPEPALCSLEVPASASPPPQEPTPIALLVEAALAAPASSLPPSTPVTPTEKPQKERPDETVAAAPVVSRESSEPEWDPQSEWSVERVMQELRIRGPQQKAIVKAVSELPKQSKRYRGKSVPEILDNISAADLYRAIGRTSPDSCEKFLNAWKIRRAKLRASTG